MLLREGQVKKSLEPNHSDSLVGSIINVFDGSAKMLREAFLKPFDLHRTGETNQSDRTAPEQEFTDPGRDKERMLVDNALPGEDAASVASDETIERSFVLAHAE